MGIEKYKWIFALIMLIALILLASIIFAKYPIVISDETFKWLIPLSFSGWVGGITIFLKWVSVEEEKKWKRDIEEMKKKTNETDSLQRVESIMAKLKDHEEVNKAQIDGVHEVLTIIDHKMDILIGKKLN